MNDVFTEKEFQTLFLSELKANGYEIWPAKGYDAQFAMDRQVLMRFLNATQPDTMKALNKIYKQDLEETLVNLINTEETKARGSRLDVLKHGIDISNMHLDLMYTKPATPFNPVLNALYEKNIFSAMEEVWVPAEKPDQDNKEGKKQSETDRRIDVVIFLNGLAIMAFELKCNVAGQNCHDAMKQYREKRSPKTRLFRWKAGVLVCFAMDLDEVYMTTQLAGKSTFFLPFNMGNGTGINAAAGNPVFEDKLSVSYMWENILQKDSVIEIISKFMFIEVKEKEDKKTGKVKKSETVIFPRYHQLDVVRKLLADVYENGTSQNYLLQHSAGSGKTNEIAWLAHRLASLHGKDNKAIFDNIIICTDRVVVDRQLQQAIMGIEHKNGMIRVMDDKCNSADLAIALRGNTKIIGTTIQKFPYIVDQVANLGDKRFAVIIDEAHSSTAGKNMAAVTLALGSGESENEDMEEAIAGQIKRYGKQPNVSMFAFTATPKSTTLQMFGKVNTKGQHEAFHVYSMRQAIEEEFILDVLQNYITYKTFYDLNKEIEEDPEMQTSDAKRQISRFIQLHDDNINERVAIIIEHFRACVMQELGGQAKAMVVTESRHGAVKYRQAFERYINEHGYTDIHALVAFSGKVKFKDDDQEYTEAGMNGFPEKNLPAEFDSDAYQVLLVADKYQTGFDQKKLCAMYILKKLHGVSAVQTLSRLNRICPPYEKKTFILDFANDYKDIEAAFSKYYTTTILANSVTPQGIYDLEAKIDGYLVLDPVDIEDFNTILYKADRTPKEKQKMPNLLQRAAKRIKSDYDAMGQAEIAMTIRHFVRFYEFLLQATCFEDVELHKKYNFLSFLRSYLRTDDPGGGFDLDGKIRATGFKQEKKDEHKTAKLHANPMLKLPVAETFTLVPAKKERLSVILAEINSRTGKQYDDSIMNVMKQIHDLLLKSDALKASARNNNETDFEYAYYDGIDDILIDGLSQNQEFFSMLLQNEEIKREVLGIFTDDVYKALREGD